MMNHDDDHDDHDDHDHVGEPLTPISATPAHGYWKSLRELDRHAPTGRPNRRSTSSRGADQTVRSIRCRAATSSS